jgi:adenine/guanine phosphoribosyltransferase-like PRPP-binding protein
VAYYEAGDFVYTSALASRVDISLVLIHEAGKLPPPIISIIKPSSYISFLVSNHSKEKWIEIERDMVLQGSSVLVVDDILSTGETLYTVL